MTRQALFAPAYLVAWSFASAAAPQGEPSVIWRNIGPGGGGWIQSIAVDPVNPDVIHVGCDVGGYYRSTDGGRTFRIQNDGLTDYFVERIVVDPSDNRIIYLATQGGVFKSVDAGAHWRLKRRGFPPPSEYHYSAPVGALVMDPTNPRVLYAGVGRPRRMSDGKGLIYKSTDGAESWTRLDGIARVAPDAVIHQIAIRPDRPEVVFAATNRGVFKSADAGRTWTRKEKGLPHRCCRNIAIHPSRPDVMYAVLWSPPGEKPWRGGVYRSDDGGESWSPRNDGLPQRVAPKGDAWQKTCNYIRLALDPRDPNHLYVGANSWWGAGLYESRDGGRRWALCTRRGKDSNMDMGWITFWGLSIKCIDVSRRRPDMVVFGDSGRVFRSDDAGAHWRQIYTRRAGPDRWQGNGLEVTCASHVAVDPFNSRKIYCGYADIGLMVSEDRGRTWSRRVQGLPMKGDVAQVVCDPERRGAAWCCEGKTFTRRPSVAMTTNGGRTWRVVGSEKTGLPRGVCRSLVLDASSPADSRTLYVSVLGFGVYKSTDAGATWRAASNGLGAAPMAVTALVIDPSRPRRLLAARRADKRAPLGGVFVTEDGGEHWRKMNRGTELPNVQALAVDPARPRVVFAACRRHYSHTLKRMFPGGLYKSEDAGRTWKLAVPDRFASCVAVSPFDHNLVVLGTKRHPYHDHAVASGVLMSRDGGRTWRKENRGLSLLCVSTAAFDPRDPSRLYVGAPGNGLFAGEIKRTGRP